MASVYNDDFGGGRDEEGRTGGKRMQEKWRDERDG